MVRSIVNVVLCDKNTPCISIIFWRSLGAGRWLCLYSIYPQAREHTNARIEFSSSSA